MGWGTRSPRAFPFLGLLLVGCGSASTPSADSVATAAGSGPAAIRSEAPNAPVEVERDEVLGVYAGDEFSCPTDSSEVSQAFDQEMIPYPQLAGSTSVCGFTNPASLPSGSSPPASTTIEAAFEFRGLSSLSFAREQEDSEFCDVVDLPEAGQEAFLLRCNTDAFRRVAAFLPSGSPDEFWEVGMFTSASALRAPGLADLEEILGKFLFESGRLPNRVLSSTGAVETLEQIDIDRPVGTQLDGIAAAISCERYMPSPDNEGVGGGQCFYEDTQVLIFGSIEESFREEYLQAITYAAVASGRTEGGIEWFVITLGGQDAQEAVAEAVVTTFGGEIRRG